MLSIYFNLDNPSDRTRPIDVAGALIRHYEDFVYDRPTTKDLERINDTLKEIAEHLIAYASHNHVNF